MNRTAEPELRVGTCSWSDPSWAGCFYPPNLPASGYLAAYAGHFDTVEIDATWYRSPSPRVVEGWAAKTPERFLFAAKAPQLITHECILLDCEEPLAEYLSSMERLGSKLGPVLFQFPYFKKAQVAGLEAFLKRLVPFLDLLPEGREYAVEVRNRSWVAPPLLEALRRRNVALALIDHPWMPRPEGYARIANLVTADFLYVRWLGDRYKIEEQTTRWDQLILDRSEDMREWIRLLREIGQTSRRFYAYFNNHYAGCGFRSADLFLDLWEGRAPQPPLAPLPAQPTLNV